MEFYIWTRKYYTRTAPGKRWHETEAETSIISQTKKETLISKEDLQFFRALGATVKVTKQYNGNAQLTNICPCQTKMTRETFERFIVPSNACGEREKLILFEALNRNICGTVEKNNADTVVIFNGDNSTCAYSFNSKCFIG